MVETWAEGMMITLNHVHWQKDNWHFWVEMTENTLQLVLSWGRWWDLNLHNNHSLCYHLTDGVSQCNTDAVSFPVSKYKCLLLLQNGGTFIFPNKSLNRAFSAQIRAPTCAVMCECLCVALSLCLWHRNYSYFSVCLQITRWIVIIRLSLAYQQWLGFWFWFL